MLWEIFAFEKQDTSELVECKKEYKKNQGKDVTQGANRIGEGNDAWTNSRFDDGGDGK